MTRGAVLILPALLAAAASAVAAADPPPFQREDFTVQQADGDGVFRLREARGQWVALHFLLKTACPFCLRHTHEYHRRAAEVPGVVHVFLKPDSPEEIASWSLQLQARAEQDTALARTAAQLPRIYRDPDAALARLFAIPDGYAFHGQLVHYPALVLLDPGGREAFRYVGKDNADRYPFDDFAAKVAQLRAARAAASGD